MSSAEPGQIYDLRLRPKDLGVILIALLCLFSGWLLMQSTTTRTRSFQDELTSLRFAYPARWVALPPPMNVVLLITNPATPSAFKTTISVENRPIDPASPPTLQDLLDRRVEQRQAQVAYQFIGESESEVGGARAIRTDYAFVTQPIVEARRDTLPVVVQTREYIIITADQSYYITLAAPEGEFVRVLPTFERMIASMEVS